MCANTYTYTSCCVGERLKALPGIKKQSGHSGKEKPLNTSQEKLLTRIRMPPKNKKQKNSTASHPPHSPWKNLNFGRTKTEMTPWGKRGDRGEGLSRDVIHRATYIFRQSPTTEVCAGRKALSLPFFHIHMFRYFLLGVWGGPTALWMTESSSGPHSFFPAPASPFILIFTAISASLVVMSLSYLLLYLFFCFFPPFSLKITSER